MICKRCNYIWNPRVEAPKACPNCKSFLWEIEPTGRPSYKLGNCILCKRRKVRMCNHHPDGKHGAITHKEMSICFRCHGILGRYHHSKNNCIDQDIQLLTEKLNILIKIKEMNLVLSNPNQSKPI